MCDFFVVQIWEYLKWRMGTINNDAGRIDASLFYSRPNAVIDH